MATATAAVALACAGSATADNAPFGQFLWWDDSGGSGPATFAGGQSITIDTGQITFLNTCLILVGPDGVNDFFWPTADVYVVPEGTADGADLEDVSETPNTITGVGGGIFISETIGNTITKYGGALGIGTQIGDGTYDVVYDECQDGKYQASHDALFPGYVIVDTSTSLPLFPSASMIASKLAAEALKEALEETHEWLEDVLDAGYAAASVLNPTVKFIKALGTRSILADPGAVTLLMLANLGKHYEGIAADPPDPSFSALTLLGARPEVEALSNDPLAAGYAGLASTGSEEEQLAEALLHSMERYQGAQQANNARWALEHARQTRLHAYALAGAIQKRADALDALAVALDADTRDFDAAAAELDAVADRVRADGFSEADVQDALNLGYSEAQIADLEDEIAGKNFDGFSKLTLLQSIVALRDSANDDATKMAAIGDAMTPIIDQLHANPSVPEPAPIADAGGPYTGTVGTALSFDASGSADPGSGPITGYEWDLDGDGAFDDATGATPAFTYARPFGGLVAVRVSNASAAAVDYARVDVTTTNRRPLAARDVPAAEDGGQRVGIARTYSVSASDPDGDPIAIQWKVDGVARAGETGTSFVYTPSIGEIGLRVIEAEVTDSPAAGGTAIAGWTIAVEAPDLDGDGWNGNVDCDDSDPLVPADRELVGNLKDDDCDATTPDTGSAPVAAFSQTVGAGLVAQFTDESVDPNEDVIGWEWDFGDGGTSTAQSPSHTYAAKGTYTVTLTVTDATSFTHTVTKSVLVAAAPTASFTYEPPSPVGGSEVEFTDTSTDSDGTIGSWAWDFGDGGTSTEQSPTHTYLGPGTFTVRLTVTDDDGSTGTATEELVIGVADAGTAPLASFRPDVPGKNLASAPGGATVVAYSAYCCGGHEPWVMLDDVVGLPWAAPKSTPNNFASIQLIGTATAPRLIDTIQVQRRHDGCCPTQGIITFAVDVSTTGFAPADFTQVLLGTMVENTLLQTFVLPTPVQAKYVRYRPLTSPDGSWLSTGTFKVLSNWAGPRRVTFTNLSTNAVSYKWAFGDGGTSTAASPTHTYATIGVYDVTLTAKSADGRTSTKTFRYEARGPTANFAVSPTVPEPGQPAVLTDTSLFPTSPGASFAWSFGDGTTSTSSGTLKTWAAAGSYEVSYTVTDAEGNADTVTKTVTVAEAAADAPPTARFSHVVGGSNVAFSGAGATIQSFSSQWSTSFPATTILNENPNDSYWATANTVRSGWAKIDLAGDLQLVDRIRIAGDGGTERVKDFRVSVSTTTADDAAFTEVLAASNPNDDNLREYVFPGGPVEARYVRIDLVNNWGHTCCVAIDRFDVLTGPLALNGRNLALAPDGASIAAFSGTYDANSYPATNLIDGNPAGNPWLTPNGVLSGWVKVTLSNTEPRLIDRVRVQGRFSNQNVRAFEIAVSTTGTDEDDFVTVLNATAAQNENLQSFELPYPMPAKHVRYRVISNYSNCCYIATGDLRVDTGQESNTLTVRFRNRSRRATSYEWDFGDGSTSTAANPVHTYAAPGTYTVTLTATNASGTSTYSLEQVVRSATLGYSPAAPEAHEQIDFVDETPAELDLQSWSWDFGDGTTSAFQHPPKTYAAPGTYTVRMTAVDREGTAHVATEDVVVETPAFRAQFHPRGTFNMASLENGAAVIAFSSQYSDVANWGAPKLLDAFTSTAWHSSASPAQSSKWIKFSLAGGKTYQIDRFQLLGRQDCCFDQHPRDFEIAVSTTGTADADFKTLIRATLPANQTTPQTYALPRPVLAKYVMYRALNSRGSSVVTTAMLRALSGQVNTPTVTFDDLTVGGAAPLTYAWAFGDGGTSSEASPTHTYAAPGTYPVTLTVTDATGATSTYSLEQKILNAPVVAFANSPLVPNEQQSTSFTDQTPSPADGPIVERRWSWDDGTANTNTSAASTAHTFADDGDYDVRLEVQDAWGQTASLTKTVAVANVAPTVEAGPSWRWREDRALTMTPTTADVAGARDPVTCTWSYGDGTPNGTGCAFSHVYSSTGTYTATVTASDGDGGTATDSFTVEVIEQEVAGGGGGSGGGTGTGAGKASKDYVYTLDADFELGTMLNVNHEAPGGDQLQLNKEAKPFPFVYIANSARGTSVRIDVKTGAVLGEYLSSPNGRARNPSRTTVDKLGNVYVTNRDESEFRTIDGLATNWGSVMRIGLLVGGTRSNADGSPNASGEYVKAPFEYNTCVDRDGDGLIRTSRGLGNILSWPNTGGVDNDGGVETAVDECIQLYTRVRGINTRTVAIDSNNDAWIGGANNWHEKLDGDTGERVPGTAFSLGCGGYGGLIDKNDVLWSARYGSGLLRYDTRAKSGVCLGNGHGDYGLGVDPVTGHIWHTNLGGNRVVKLDPTKTSAATIEIARYPHGNESAQGVAVDAKGNVWVAHALFGATTIGRVRTDGTYLGNASLGGGNGPTGVAVDANGKVWSANINTSTATRVDPEIGQKIASGAAPSGWFDMNVNLGAGAGPYNYSDMTGAVAVGAASPSGFWSIKQDAGVLGTIWKRISWDGSSPGGTSITVEARAADTQAALPSASFVVVTDGAPLSGIVGRFVEVRATLQTSDPAATPILTDIRISANTPPVATDTAAETDKDTAKAITLPATDDDGDALTYELVDAPAHGSVAVTGNVATYTPAPGYTGPDSFTFKALDGTGESNVATVTVTVLQTNQPPVAPDVLVSTDEDTPLTILLPATDPDGDLLTLTTTDPTHGTFAGGVYTPDADYFGSDSFEYTATDPDGESDTGLVTIAVLPVNDAPTALDRSLATDEDTPLPITLGGGDIDGDALTVTTTDPAHGTYAGGVYTPDPDYFGPDSFDYTVDDGNGGTATATVTIDVRPVNDAPVAADQSVATDEDTPLPIALSGTDVDGDTLTITTTDPAHGTYVGGVYTPDANYFGPDTFDYTVDDGHGGTDTATVTIDVRPVNDPPVADDTSIVTDEDTAVTFTLPAGDVDDVTLTFAAGPAAHGSIAISGSVATYTPDPDYNGGDSFTFTATDTGGLSDDGTVTVTVRPVNDAPTAADRSVATDEDTPLPIALSGTDVDGDTLTITTTDPAHGTYVGGVYTPDANYFGPDTFDYTVDDGNGGTDTATVTIDVRPVNDPPVADDTSIETDEDTPVTFTLPASDVDDATLTLAAGSPAHGTVSVSGTVATYTPAPDYNGPDSFEFTATDAAGATDTGTVTIAVRPVNDAPVAADQSVATDEDTPLPITLAATDVDGDTLVYVPLTAPQHGTWDGTTYTPAPDYFGPDSFAFVVSDGNGGTDAGTVTIDVRPVNDAPVAADQSVATDEDTPLPITLAATDVDGDTLTYTTVTPPQHGSWDGGTYTPAPNYFGPDSLEFRADDGNGGTDTATVTITVRPVNDAPNVEDASAETNENTPVAIALAGTDVDGDTLTFTWSDPPHGSFDGATYTPDPNYFGPDSFTYTANDGRGGTDSATVSITVHNVNQAPSVRLAPATVDEGAAPVTLTADATDPDGDPLTYTWTAGTGTLTPAGATAGYANDDGPRLDTVTVTVSDGELSASATAEILVRNVAPTANAGADQTTYWGLPLLFTGTATDPSAADTAAGFVGQWSFDDGTLPLAGMSAGHGFAQPGDYTATFSVVDKDGGSDTDTATVTVEKRPTSLAYTGPATALYGLRTLTAQLTDTADATTADLAGKTVVFELGTRTFTAVTDADGVATATAVLPLTSGTVELSFAGDAFYLASSARADLTIVSGPGMITGGGLRSFDHPGRGGFNVHSEDKGELQWQNGTLDFHAPALTALGVAPDGRSAWFAGLGRDGRRYVAYVEDNGEPGSDDVFKLWIAGRLQTPGDGKLAGGNVQIHK